LLAENSLWGRGHYAWVDHTARIRARFRGSSTLFNLSQHSPDNGPFEDMGSHGALDIMLGVRRCRTLARPQPGCEGIGEAGWKHTSFTKRIDK
jgi:hypothetical protein